MQTAFEIVESEALKLNITERAKLAEHLIASLSARRFPLRHFPYNIVYQIKPDEQGAKAL